MNISDVWNSSLGNKSNRKFESRDYIYASEIGKSHLDIYLSMTGVEPTTPPDIRAKRKFDAGNLWEWIVGSVLKRSGILQSNLIEQQRIKYSINGMLEVSGRPDFLIGGQPDYERARYLVNQLDNQELFDSIFLKLNEKERDIVSYLFELTASLEFVKRQSLAMIDFIEKNNPYGVDDKVVEVKSSSSHMFNLRLETETPDMQHVFQSFHYGYHLKRPTNLFYIDKDSCRLLEFEIPYKNTPILDLYVNEVSAITEYYRAGVQPPKEKEITYNGQRMRFEANWKIQYSQYLYSIYGYKHSEEFRLKYQSLMGSWNRVLNRCVNGEKMTKANLIIIEDIKNYFPNFDDLVYAKRQAKKNVDGGDGEQEAI